LNPAAEYLARYTNSQALGLPVEQIWTNWPSQLEPASTVFEELTLAHAGEQRTYSLHPYSITDHKNRSLNKVVLLIDITERKQAEKALLESNKRFEDIAEDALEWIWEIAIDGKYTYASSVVERVLGYKPEEIIGKYFYDLIHPDDREELKKVAFTAFATKQPFRQLANKNIHKSGKIIWLLTIGTPILDSQGNLLGYRGVDTDITERKQAEDSLKQSYEKLQKTLNDVILAMASTSEIRDPYTAGHQRMVARLARAIAVEMKLSEHQISGVYTAGLVHDIGKISIPPEILTKSRRLNDIEFALIKIHPQAGYDILNNMDFPFPLATWVLQHHERLNGSGYPAGLTGDKISIESKIVAIADVVGAMASHRPYRPALNISEALDEIIRNKGILYDPEVVDACVRVIKEKGFKLDE
jgi:PAS domain S-box-containing protein